jgi:hypothetical protein
VANSVEDQVGRRNLVRGRPERGDLGSEVIRRRPSPQAIGVRTFLA